MLPVTRSSWGIITITAPTNRKCIWVQFRYQTLVTRLSFSELISCTQLNKVTNVVRTTVVKSNAERINMKRSKNQTDFVILNTGKCRACWKCLENCSGVISCVSFLWHKHVVIANADKCTGCLQCVNVCSAGAFSCI